MQSSLLKTLGLRTAVAVAAVIACSAASALPTFTVTPGALGDSFTADNLLISDYATVTKTATGFTETGYLAITGFQLGTSTLTPAGYGTNYGFYIAFSGSATQTYSVGTASGGTFDSLSYTLYEYTGSGSFTPTSAPLTGLTALGTGSLIDGSFTATTVGGKVTFAGSDLDLSFAAIPNSVFSPSYTLAESTFSNTTSEITNTSTGFIVTQGGGSVNFVAAVPEPETYALMLGGLAAVGFLARRRKNG